MNRAQCWVPTLAKLGVYLVLQAVIVSSLFSTVSAQVTASIVGTIKDRTGAPIPGVSVTVRSQETNAVRVLATDETGNYRVLSLPVGLYEVKAEKQGFKPETKSGINLTVGQEVIVSFTIEVGDVRDSLLVTAEVSIVNTATASTAGLVGEREVKDLPLNGRSFDNLITLNPGTVNTTSNRTIAAVAGSGNEFSVSGRRVEENLFLLNGIEYNSVNDTGTLPGGVSGQLLGIDAIREFNVQKETYSAEYGKKAGGQVSIVTMSGTNSFHGSAFEFLRNSALDARNFFDRGDVPPFKRNNFGAAVGGPIWKNRTFVFGNYEGFRQRLGLSSVAVVPDENTRRGLVPNPADPAQLINVGIAPGVAPYFALWPEPNGRNLGDGTALAFTNPSQKIREDFFNVRLDHILSTKDTLAGVYTFDDGDSQTPGDNPFTQSANKIRSQVFSLEESHVLSPTIINIFRIGFTRVRWNFDGAPPFDTQNLGFVKGRPVGNIRIGRGALANIVGGLTEAGSITNSQNIYLVRNLYTFTDSVQISRGIHLFSAGGWLQRLQSNEDGAFPKNGQFAFNTLTDFLAGRATTFLAVPSPTLLGWRQWLGAWYVQDTLKLRPNFTLNLGLRHEFTNGLNEVAGRASNFVTGPDGKLLTAPRIGNSIFTKNNAKKLFGPRISLAWDPFGKEKTSIRAGFGIYYSLQDHIGFCCTSNAPFNTQFSFANQTFPFQIQPGVNPGGSATVAPIGIQSDLDTPTIIQWSLRLEQAISAKIAVSANYVGSHGYHERVVADLNTVVPTILPDGRKFFPAGAPRRNPQLANSRHWMSWGDNFYHSLQLEAIQRLRGGLYWRTSYTFSKNIDNGTILLSGQQAGSSQQLVDPEDAKRDKGLSALDVRNRFSFSAIYELPLGKGKSLFGNASGLADKLVSGWQINSIVNLQSGFPFTPLLGFSRSRNGDSRAPDRPNLKPGFTYDQIILGRPDRWFDPNAFALPEAGTYGNVGRNVLEGPGMATVDVALFKTTHIYERLKLQFRAEGFNILNRANFALPSNAVLNPDGSVRGAAGIITRTATTSRQLQFGLKLIW